jgi:hypothetical protein
MEIHTWNEDANWSLNGACMGKAWVQRCCAVKKSDGTYKLPYLFFSSITLLAGKWSESLGMETL